MTYFSSSTYTLAMVICMVAAIVGFTVSEAGGESDGEGLASLRRMVVPWMIRLGVLGTVVFAVLTHQYPV